jgi:hypothetical protein
MELNKEKIIKDSVYSLARRLPPPDLTTFLEDLSTLLDKKDLREKCVQIGFPLKV